MIKILFLVVAAAPCFAQVATSDLFDRANSNSLGADWTEQDGDAKIANNKLEANSPSTYGWCSHNVFNANYASTVIRANWSMNGLGGDRIALIAGVNPSNWSGIEVRIADNNGDGTADRIFFNAAVNAGAWYAGSPSFVNIATPMISGEATMWFSNNGDTVNIALRDLVTSAVQTYSSSGILANPPTGTKVGIGYFGNGNVDDFRAWVGSPTAPVFTMNPPRVGAPATLLITDMMQSAFYAIGYSTAGAGPIFTPYGVLGLSDPIEILFQGQVDPVGRVELPLGIVPSVAGLTVHLQAFDGSALALTNYYTVTVQ
jgi:hypothetical protein